MARDYFKSYNKRSDRRRSKSELGFGNRRTIWTVPRIIGAIACFLGVVVLAVLAVHLAQNNEEEPDNVATRLSETPSPTPSPTPKAVATQAPTPTPTPQHRKKAVALTFDDGPKSTEVDKDITGTSALLDTLKAYEAHATFFVVGNRCKIDKDILNREVAEGHEIGNHTWDHAQLSRLSMKEVNKEIGDTTDIVKELTGYTISLVRPPYGSVSQEMRDKLKYPMIIWDVDTRDWEIDTKDYTMEEKEEKIFKNVKKNVTDGSIILMHDIHECSVRATERIVEWLEDNDYDVLTVSELMERKGIDMKNGKVYANAS